MFDGNLNARRWNNNSNIYSYNVPRFILLIRIGNLNVCILKQKI